MRCAELLVELAGEGDLDRTGGGLVVEVYPAAALRQWGFDPRGYKATSQWLELPQEQRVLLAASDHLFDALVSALVGRAVELGRTLPVPDEHRALAASEGWIHLPKRQPLSQFRHV